MPAVEWCSVAVKGNLTLRSRLPAALLVVFGFAFGPEAADAQPEQSSVGGAASASASHQVTDLQPESGAPGTTVRIYGSGFSSNPSGNTVTVGTAEATVLSATSRALRAEVPSGPEGPVEVTVTTSGSAATAAERFTVVTGGGISFSSVGAGLSGVFSGSSDWGDYDSDGDLDLIVTGDDSATIYRNDGDGTFSPIGAGLAKVSESSSDWGDYDSDGDLDLVVTGEDADLDPSATIYRNEGSGTFTAIGAGLGGVVHGSSDWGDYDADGDLDLVVAGEDADLDRTATIYQNTGDGTFTAIGAGLTPVETWPSSNWGDYDGDGDLDLVLTGNSDDQGDIATIYRNDGGGTFTAIEAGLTGVDNSSTDWGDYDSDGDLDLVVTGLVFQNGNFTSTATIYRNDGGGIFTAIGAGLTGVFAGSADWGDFDGDGDLDLIVTGDENGFDDGGSGATIYRNDGDGTFTAIGAGLTEVTDSSSDWGDFDGDGDLDLVVTGDDADGNSTATLYQNAVVDTTAPDPPSALQAEAPDSTTVELQWTESDSADVSLYHLYRDTAPIDSAEGPGDRVPLATRQASETAFTDTTVQPKQTYYYRATAVDTAGNESSFSGQAQVAAGDTSAPDPPGPITAEEAGEAAPADSARVRWAKSDSADVERYSVYRDTARIDSSAGPGELEPLAEVGKEDTTYLDPSAQPNQAYHYRVTATDSSSNESGFSDDGAVALGDTSAPDPPGPLQAEALAPDSVRVRWASSDSADVGNYRLYRDTTAIDSSAGPGGREPLATTGAEDTSYVDTSIEAGQTYHYRATAVDSAGNESGFSGEGTATPGIIELGPLVLRANQIEETDPGVYQLEGNVTVSQTLALSGTVTANTGALSIEGNGSISVIPGPVDQIYSGEYALSLASEAETFLNGEVLAAANSVLQAGGLDVQLDGIEILTEKVGIRVEGALTFPDILSKIEPSISTLQVTKETGLDFTGSVEVDSVRLKKGIATLKTLSLTYASAENKFEGSARLATRAFEVGASATMIEGMLESVKLDVELERPIPIASTGVGLAGATGAISGLVEPPTKLKIGADLVPVPAGKRVVRLDNLSLAYRFDTKITGSGTLQLFERDQAMASLTVTAQKATFDGQVGLSVPAAAQDVLSGEVGAGVSQGPPGPPLQMNGSLEGTLVIPAFEGFPFDWLSWAVGLPYTVAQTDNTLEAEPLAGTGQTRGNTSVLGFGFAYGVGYDQGDLSADFAKNMSNLNLKLFPRAALRLKAGVRRKNRFEGQSLIVGSGRANRLLKRSADTLRQSFVLTEEQASLFLRVEGGSGAPAYTVTTPGGQTLVIEEAAGRSDVTVAEIPEKNKTFFAFEAPAPGEWTVNLPDGGTEYALDVIGADPAPAVQMDPPGQSGSSVTLSWTASLPGGEGQVALYYDTDRQDQDGILIAEDLPDGQASYTWDVSGVPTGSYVPYVVADDGRHAPAVAYAPEAVQITEAGAPSAPDSAEAAPADTALGVSWAGSANADRYVVYYREGQAPTLNPAGPTRRAGVGDTTAVALQRIASGRTYYVAVQAIGPGGQESPLSPVDSARWESPAENDAPLITTKAPEELAFEGETYEQPVGAEDADEDPLTWTLAEGPEGMTVSGEGQLRWETPEAGTHPVTVRVADPAGAADSLGFMLRTLGREGAAARVAFSEPTYAGTGAMGQIAITDRELNRSAAAVESTQVQVRTTATSAGTALWLRETRAGSGQFRGTFGFGGGGEGRPAVPVEPIDTLSVTYEDAFPDTTVAARTRFYEQPPPRRGPALAGPREGPVPTAPTLAWEGLGAAGRYRVQVSTDPAFGEVLREEVTADTSLVPEGLEKGASYHWRVRAELQLAGTVLKGPWAGPIGFETRPATLQISFERPFGAASGPGDYRLVALPGAADRPLAETVQGEAGTDWQAWWDDGSAENYLQKHDGSETFAFRPGRGFWLTSRRPWTVDGSIETVSLTENRAASVPLHEGWNIVSNPLERDVLWSAVTQANGGPDGSGLGPIWQFGGSFRRADTLRSAAAGVAYYVLNDGGLDSLRIPYPPATGGSARGGSTTADSVGGKHLVLRARQDGAVSSVRIGAGEGRSGGNAVVVAPPGRFSRLALRIDGGAGRAPRRRLLAADAREARYREENGLTVPLRLTARGEGPTKVEVEGRGALQDQKAALLHPAAGRSYPLSEGSAGKEPVELRLRADTARLELALGPAAFLDEKRAAITPDEVRLVTYPNPAARQATVEYALPDRGPVRLVLYDVLGRRIQAVADGPKRAGRHRARLSARALPSGTYFLRLQAGGQTRTQKLTIVR